jgi:hypothetical protein
VTSSSNRHPVVLLGAAASLITVLSFFGVRSWPGSEPTPTPVAATDPAPTQPAPTQPAPTQPAPTQPARTTVRLESSAPAPTPTCRCTGPTPTPRPTAVSCVIQDRLGDGQAAETVTLRFGSKDFELSIDSSDPTDRLTLRFPQAGTYRYSAAAETETIDGDVLVGTGAGTIRCDGDQTFQVTGDYGTDPATVALEEA